MFLCNKPIRPALEAARSGYKTLKFQQALTLIKSSHWLTPALSAALLAMSATVSAQSSNFNELPTNLQNAIKRICLPMQFSKGTQAYRQCVTEKLSSGTNIKPIHSDQINFDQMFALQQTCETRFDIGQSDYVSCVRDGIATIESRELSDTTLPVDRGSQATDGNSNFVRVTTQSNIIERQSAPSAPDTPKLAGALGHAEYVATSVDAANEKLPNTIVLAQATTPSKTPRVISRPQTSSNEATTETSPGDSVTGSSTSTAANSSANTETSSETNGENAPAQNTATNVAAQPAQESTGSGANLLSEKITLPSWVPEEVRTPLGKLDSNSLTGIGLVAILTAMLALLLPLMVGKRRSNSAADYAPDTAVYDPEKSFLDEPQHQLRPESQQAAARTPTHDPAALGSMDHVLDDETPAVTTTRVRSAVQPENYSATSSTHQSTVSDSEALGAEAEKPDPARQAHSELGQWLASCNPDLRQRLCIQFLLHWINFADKTGDKGPDHQTIQQLRSDMLEDDHARIKLAAIDDQARSLADVLGYIKTEFSNEQQTQILNLMLAVLVKTEISPIQNTLLRFFADVIGIGNRGLEARFQAAFGYELPPMPRPDREPWWQKQSTVQQPTRPCFVGEDAGRDQIKVAASLARNRFNPALFDLLGNKEQRLVRRHYTGFKEQLAALQEPEL